MILFPLSILINDFLSPRNRGQAWRYSCFAGCWYYCYQHVYTRSSAGVMIKVIITTAVVRSTVLACRRTTWPPWRTRLVSATPSSAEWRRCRRRRRRWGRIHRHLITSPSWYRRCHLRSRMRHRHPVTTRYAMKSPDQREIQGRTRPKSFFLRDILVSPLHSRRSANQFSRIRINFHICDRNAMTMTHRQHNKKWRGSGKRFARLYFLVGIIWGSRERGEEPCSSPPNLRLWCG